MIEFQIEVSSEVANEISYILDNEPGEWVIMDEDTADKQAREYILDSVWAFNMDFLSSHLKIETSPRIKKSLTLLCETLCEDANDILLALIKDEDRFVQEAIALDGRAHFMSAYDGKEVEICVGGKWFLAYRMN